MTQRLNYENAGHKFTGSMNDVTNEIEEHAKQFVKSAGNRPMNATGQPLRVVEIAPPGTELVPGHPALQKKV